MCGKPWSIGGRRLNNAERNLIVDFYLTCGKATADKIAVELFGLSPDYAYKLLNSRGLLPRGPEEGGRHCRAS
jgi:hypothetical protein